MNAELLARKAPEEALEMLGVAADVQYDTPTLATLDPEGNAIRERAQRGRPARREILREETIDRVAKDQHEAGFRILIVNGARSSGRPPIRHASFSDRALSAHAAE